MKILITGIQGLADALRDVYIDHEVTSVSKSGGYNIQDIEQWGKQFLNYDLVFNCAYSGFDQVNVLEFFYRHWKDDSTKKIVSIGSRCITHRRIESSDDYWPYKVHKQALQSAHDSMQLEAKCDLKIFNPGPIDTQMIAHLNTLKMSTQELAARIKTYTEDRFVKRIDLWI